MITIKHSLIELLQTENLTVKCAKSTYGNTFYDEEETELTFNLKIGYNEIDFNAFLEFLNQQNELEIVDMLLRVLATYQFSHQQYSQ